MTIEEKATAYAESRITVKCPRLDKLITPNEKRIERFDGYDIEQAYEDGATEALASQWRSVEEELPHPDTICLVIGYKDLDFNGRFLRYTAMAWYDGEDFYDAYNDRKYHPVKWMAIPLPDTNTEKK